MDSSDDDTVPTVVYDAPTVPRCNECGRVCIVGGPIVPTREAMEHAVPEECARGEGWTWCPAMVPALFTVGRG